VYINPKFGKGLGWINSLAAQKTAETMAAPTLQLKRTVEGLLDGYTPPLEDHVVERLELTWKGGLWKMALEAALGVQYLHHHRYWSDGGKRHNGATNEVEEEEAGWKVRSTKEGPARASEASVKEGPARASQASVKEGLARAHEASERMSAEEGPARASQASVKEGLARAHEASAEEGLARAHEALKDGPARAKHVQTTRWRGPPLRPRRSRCYLDRAH
jgi:hypothetical protein